MKVKFSKDFAKQLNKYSTKTLKVFEKRLEIFLTEPYSPILHNYALKGKWDGYRSINVGGDLRAVFELIKPDFAYFVAFGSHRQLYD